MEKKKRSIFNVCEDMVQYCSYDEQRNVNTSRDAFKKFINFYIKKNKEKSKTKNQRRVCKK